MKIIQLNDPHAQKHFDFFNKMAAPHFNITANIEIGDLFAFLKDKQVPITPTLVYIFSRAANEIPEFRQRIRGDQIVEHEVVSPSFTVKTEKSKFFSFCYVDFQMDKLSFIEAAQKSMLSMNEDPSFEDEEERDDFLFFSSIPWISFTGFQHAMHNGKVDSIPRIVWGKAFSSEGKNLMPVSVQVHHALVDGEQVAQYFKKCEKIIALLLTDKL